MRPLYRRHDPASQTRYQDAAQLARTQARVLAGSPGTLKQRTQSGKRYWVREHMRIDGAKVDEYLGPAADLGEKRLDALRAEVALARSLASASAALRLAGFQRLERDPAAVLAVLFNRGLTGAGLTLVGSHAYGVLLNELGAIAPAYRTRDLDLARARPLDLAVPAGKSFAALLGESGLGFVPVPGMPSSRPSASFKLPGAEAMLVDLLVPGSQAGKIVPVPELASYGQTIPLLGFLSEHAIDSVVLSPNQIVPVRVPAPERFVLHKLFASQSRRAHPGKARKDLEQAALLAAALEAQTPGRLRETWRRFPAAGRPACARAAGPAARLLGEVHPEALEALSAIGKR